MRYTTKELLEELSKQGNKMKKLVDELRSLWANTEERLQNISATEDVYNITLFKNFKDDGDDAGDETKSEYSVSSQQSLFSSLSERSSKSGTSTVSVLSNLSASSSSSAVSASPSTAFSITGLDHTLLSRGTVNDSDNRGPPNTKTKRKNDSLRKQKRQERSKVKGSGKDIWGLRKENNLCEELLSYACVGEIARAVHDLCEVLFLVGGISDRLLAIELHSAMDNYATVVQENAPPLAPDYPLGWLLYRSMASVTFYQDYSSRNRESIASLPPPVLQGMSHELQKTWWSNAAEGIAEWHKLRVLLAK